MDKKPEWVKIDQTTYHCPRCDALVQITRASGKESPAEWQKRLDRLLLAHLDEHQRRDKLTQADDDAGSTEN
jgi:hypothetical protein